MKYRQLLIAVLCAAMLNGSLLSASAGAKPGPIPLWPNGAPGSEEWDQLEVETTDFLPHRVVRNVVEPALYSYPADASNNTGIGLIVAPGGGFKFLSIDTEGTQVAEWLQSRGINAFVLKYRLDETAASPTLFKLQVAWFFLLAKLNGEEDFPDTPLSPVQALAIEDALAAIAYVRDHAGRWGVRRDAIGMLGFSAGGAVATGAAMDSNADGRPDFVGSIYGVPAIGDVPHNAPPLYVLATEDDPVVPLTLGESLHARWLAAGYSSTLAVYPDGGHGFGMQRKGSSTDAWIEEFHQWLKAAVTD